MRARAGTAGSTRAVDLAINAPGSIFLPAFLLSLTRRTADKQVVAAGFCSPRACVKQQGLAAVVVGSLVVATVRARAKARLGHGGGLTEFCKAPDDGAGVPASERERNRVREVHTSQGVHGKQEWPAMAPWFARYLEVDLARVLASTSSGSIQGSSGVACVHWGE